MGVKCFFGEIFQETVEIFFQLYRIKKVNGGQRSRTIDRNEAEYGLSKCGSGQDRKKGK